MNYKLSIFLSLLLVILVACDNVDVSKVSDKDLGRLSEKLVVCNTPYIRFGTSCCLDKNNNSICDNDEIKKDTSNKNESVEINNTQPVPQQKIEEKLELDLKNYPQMLIQSKKFDGIIIVGDKADPQEVMAANNIASSLNNYTKTSVKLCSEVLSIANIDSILVGNSCTNACIAEVLSKPSDCKAGLEPGKGRIDIYNWLGGIDVVVSGYIPLDVIRASEVLSNYKEYKLEGTSMKVFRMNNKNFAVASEPINAHPERIDTV